MRLFFGNIIWFIPLGVMLPIVMKRKKFFLTIAIGFLFSFTIETIQYLFYKGVAELDDLILNTLGVAIGYSIYQLKQHTRSRKKVFNCRQI
jgi:glycopeptide antibiotics resistance protein